ncbi:hypothetical protein EU534_01305 [Candidatus Heimdallarchaeota archaeon]|nr:MAG: hypothetical protein EU534_01305 [Candidatus Heimdallarchaeota archaeon]
MVNEDDINFHYQAFFPSPNFIVDDYLQKIRLNQWPNVHLQLVDPSLIISKRHIQIALYHTQKNFKQGNNIARDHSTEFLLRISGKKQISSALELFGVKGNSKIILVIAFGGNPSENEGAVKSFIKQMKITEDNLFEIKFPILNDEELSMTYQCGDNVRGIEKCVLERIALLNIL